MKGQTVMKETIDIYMHSHADTGEFLGLDWCVPPGKRLDIVGVHTEHAVDLLLAALEDPGSFLSECIAERVGASWPAWQEQTVRFEIDWNDGYYVSAAGIK